MKLSIPHAELRRTLGNAVLYASSDSTRPTLTAVRIEFGPLPRFVATDSYALITQPIECEAGDEPGDFLLGLTDAKALLVALKNVPRYSRECVDLIAEGDTLTAVVPGGATFAFRGNWGEFPNYEQLMPTGDPIGTPSIAFPALEFTRLAKVDPGGDRKPKRGHTSSWRFWGELKPALVKVGAAEVLVMPVRLG